MVDHHYCELSVLQQISKALEAVWDFAYDRIGYLGTMPLTLLCLWLWEGILRIGSGINVHNVAMMILKPVTLSKELVDILELSTTNSVHWSSQRNFITCKTYEWFCRFERMKFFVLAKLRSELKYFWEK
ncbi:hypothetical protein KF7HA_01446 [Lactococcus lactis]|nr:hypothetical protein [Lactococcus lactis]